MNSQLPKVHCGVGELLKMVRPRGQTRGLALHVRAETCVQAAPFL